MKGLTLYFHQIDNNALIFLLFILKRGGGEQALNFDTSFPLGMSKNALIRLWEYQRRMLLLAQVGWREVGRELMNKVTQIQTVSIGRTSTKEKAFHQN